MKKTAKQKEVKSTRNTNRMKQVRYLCQLLEDSRTAILHVLDPENFEAPIEKEYYGRGCQEDAVKTFNKHKDEYIAELTDLAAYMGLSMLETFTFTVIVARQIGKNEDEVSISDITSHLDINGLEGMPFYEICEKMVEKQYLEQTYSRFGNTEYKVTESIIDSIRHNDASLNINNKKEPIDQYEFCKQASELVHNLENLVRLKEAIGQLESKNLQLEFIIKLRDMCFSLTDRILFYEIANDCIKGDDSSISSTCEDVFCGNKRLEIDAMKSLKDESHILIQNNFVELCADSFFDHSEMTLSDNGKEFLFGEDKVVFMKGKKNNDKRLLDSSNIPVRELFYDKDLKSDIDFIEKSIDPDEFKKLQERLTAKAMNKGVAILFYGAPGTGKSETVMQLARRTGRKVYHVDISASKTCWYGESEKLIKSIFTTYKKMCKEESLTPILLFNEADALLGKRRTNINGSCDQTDNAIQNILLEEMEQLEGIMIATTNFEGNLDAAFERRFLMKVNFRKPSVESKEAIWHYKLPTLPAADCRTLAIRYDLSGGEIDNVVRKITMTEVLQGTTPTIEALCTLCEKERLSKEWKHIGF